MFTTEMALILPLILILLVSILFFFIYIVHEDLVEISANTLLYKKLYNVSVNNKPSIGKEGVITEKNSFKSEFTLPQAFSIEVSEVYPSQLKRNPKCVRYNPRVFLLIKNGVIKAIGDGE